MAKCRATGLDSSMGLNYENEWELTFNGYQPGIRGVRGMMLSTMKGFLSALIVLLTVGCASISIHGGAFMSDVVGRDPRLESPTPIFGGVSTDIRALGEGLLNPFRRQDGRWFGDGLIFIGFPLTVLDVPFSLAADIVYLPSDIAFWPQWSDHQKSAASNPQ